MTITAIDIFGGIGNATSIIFFFLPLTLIIELIRTKDNSKIPWLLFLFTILNCLFWLIYGILINSWPIYLCNSIGSIMNYFYLITYIIYTKHFKFSSKLTLIAVLIGAFPIILFLFVYFLPYPKAVGTIACVMNVLMYFGPLQNIRKVVANKDNSYIPICLSINLLINSIVWVTFSILKDNDLYIMIPNILGILLSLIQITFWFCYKRNDNCPATPNGSKSDEEINSKSDKDEELGIKKK